MVRTSTTHRRRSRLRSADRTLQREIVVIGAGGHGRELADIVRSATSSDDDRVLLGIADDGVPNLALLARLGVEFLGSSADVLHEDVEVLIGIGDPAVRQRLDLVAPNRAARPVFHPTASVGSANALSSGVVLAQEATVTTNVRLGRHTHLNVGASVSHDCRIGDYVTICPGVRVTGNVFVGDRVFIGTGAVLLPGVSVGDDAIIGAGAVVCEDIPAAKTVRGVPAR